MVWVYHSLFIHSSVGGHSLGFHLLVIMKHAVMNIHVQFFVLTCFSFFLRVFLRVEWMGHMVTLCIIF